VTALAGIESHLRNSFGSLGASRGTVFERCGLFQPVGDVKERTGGVMIETGIYGSKSTVRMYPRSIALYAACKFAEAQADKNSPFI